MCAQAVADAATEQNRASHDAASIELPGLRSLVQAMQMQAQRR